MTETKPWYKSKTIIFNILMGIITILWPYFKEYITPEQAGAFVVIGNMILRVLTDKGLTST